MLLTGNVVSRSPLAPDMSEILEGRAARRRGGGTMCRRPSVIGHTSEYEPGPDGMMSRREPGIAPRSSRVYSSCG
ncbi:hypothetical protein ATL42_1651 [Sanguibacter antarcticus]|uniref:Uncharacterized protein n=1 Tax=Sanguibacter antarcticus TaxID=372484 RepID=A0A2A9E4I5_9MICO|nr:hypothetical protein ATL42_1651 [Sanguibacter antarcticus]